MEAFKALSFGDRWRARRHVYRGEAPADPRMAAAAIALAERYQRNNEMQALRWGAPFLAIGGLCLAIWGAIEGDVLAVVIWGFTGLGWAGHLMLNPATRPKMVARSLQASRQVVASSN